MQAKLTNAEIIERLTRGQSVNVRQHSAPNGGDLLSPNFTIHGKVRAWKLQAGSIARLYVDWEDGISNWIDPDLLEVLE